MPKDIDVRALVAKVLLLLGRAHVLKLAGLALPKGPTLSPASHSSTSRWRGASHTHMRAVQKKCTRTCRFTVAADPAQRRARLRAALQALAQQRVRELNAALQALDMDGESGENEEKQE